MAQNSCLKLDLLTAKETPNGHRKENLVMRQWHVVHTKHQREKQEILGQTSWASSKWLAGHLQAALEIAAAQYYPPISMVLPYISPGPQSQPRVKLFEPCEQISTWSYPVCWCICPNASYNLKSSYQPAFCSAPLVFQPNHEALRLSIGPVQLKSRVQNLKYHESKGALANK